MKEVLDSKGRETYIEHSDGTWVKSEYMMVRIPVTKTPQIQMGFGLKHEQHTTPMVK